MNKDNFAVLWRQAINEIKTFIPENNIETFNNYVANFEKQNNFACTLIGQSPNPDKSTKTKKKKVPKDLEKRLFETVEVKPPKYNFDKDTATNAELVEIGNQILSYLVNQEKKNKGYYYNIGDILFCLKEKYTSEKEFLAYAKREFNRSKSIILDYIRFYDECNTYNGLINCNLSYREIMKNLVEIRKIFEKCKTTENKIM
jgi:hypothetical protein